MTLKNRSKRAYTLPGATSTTGAEFGGQGLTLKPGQAMDVPDWYAMHLVTNERSWALRCAAGDVELVDASGRLSPLPPLPKKAIAKFATNPTSDKKDIEIAELKALVSQLLASAESKKADPKR